MTRKRLKKNEVPQNHQLHSEADLSLEFMKCSLIALLDKENITEQIGNYIRHDSPIESAKELTDGLIQTSYRPLFSAKFLRQNPLISYSSQKKTPYAK